LLPALLNNGGKGLDYVVEFAHEGVGLEVVNLEVLPARVAGTGGRSSASATTAGSGLISAAERM
jgi:hypothetical protein